MPGPSAPSAPVRRPGTCVDCGREVESSRCAFCGVATTAGPFTIDRVIARTAHSRVYAAHDAGGRPVALKELQFAQVPSALELEAFEREGRTVASLAHPGIPTFVASFREGEGVGLRLYLATELITGETLAHRVKGGVLAPAALRRVAHELLGILAYLHGRTPVVLHRDVKPENIVFRPDGRVVLVDFGSVRTLGGSRTHGSTLVGTYGYMPPEQLGGTVDRSSDLYALAATLLHALTGRSPSELLRSDLSIALPPGVPDDLRPFFASLLALDPTKRTREVEVAKRLLDGGRRHRLGRAVVVGLLAGLALVGAARVLAGRDSATPAPAAPPLDPTDARGWFERARPHCNVLEVQRTMRQTPPPDSLDGIGLGALCFALAGDTAKARALIYRLPPGDRARAVNVVFEVAHPIADAGDDVVTAPIMRLVVEFWPNHYEALYHLGISEFELGQDADATAHLTGFLALYSAPDGFTQRAREALAKLAERAKRTEK